MQDINMGPVNDQAAFDKVMSYVEIGKEEGRIVSGGEGDDSKGWFIQPTIVADVAESSFNERRNLRTSSSIL